MLESLRVRNLAVVEHAEVRLGRGLNVITGETGAGKSVLAGALSLLLGERADRSMIRSGADQCAVEAAFRLADASAVDGVLEEFGIPACEDGVLILRRTFTASGAGRSLVNDSPTTLQVLKRLGDVLVDMHGPHDHQSLLSPEFQVDLLDAFGHHWKDRAAYEQAFDAMSALAARRDELNAADGDVSQAVELLAFQEKELAEADLKAGEEEELEREHARASNAQNILEAASAAVSGLTEAEASAFTRLAEVQQTLGRLQPVLPEAADWVREAQSAAVQVKELSRTVEAFAASVEGDPKRLAWLDERLTLYRKLKRKYAPTAELLLEKLADVRGRLNDLRTRGQQLAEVEERLRAARAAVVEAGGRLRARRRASASRLADGISAQLRDLGFAHGVFAVTLAACEPKRSGTDAVEFSFAPNPGEPARALKAVASSGEISRVMLAAKTVLAAHDRIPVLVFDEIDTNIGGEMGNAVGQKLRAVAGHHQVVCITHLPQVAACGDLHFAVRKDVSGGRTFTRIDALDDGERELELARMLGGRDHTTVTLRHARELLARVRA